MELLSLDLFYVRKVLGAIVLPPNGPLILAFTGLLLLRRRPKLGRVLAWLGLMILLILSMPVISDALLNTLDDSGPLNFDTARTAQAIVIPGGGIRRALEYGGDTVGQLTLERVRYGALVARQTGLPVLVSGGPVSGGTTEAQVMRQTLVDEFGVEVKWMETQSRNTHENALRSAEILRAHAINRVILVSHGFDMRRARAEFEVAGLEVVPGQDYHFVSNEQFLAMCTRGEFLESAQVYGNHYGTSAQWTSTTIAAGFDVILEIDWQGASQVRQRLPETITIFIFPPSLSALEQRLRVRAQDSPQVIEQRLQAARAESRHVSEYDYVIINKDFATAVADLASIVKAGRLKRDKQLGRHHNLIRELT